MLAAQGLLDPARLARLQAVGEARAQLHHPNISVIYDFGEHNGELYVARELVEGGSLADVLGGPARPAEQTAALVETLARAIHHAHQHGLVHGGLKLGKVLLGTDGVPKITGFGLAGVLSDEPSVSDPATDVCALGAILYEMLTGRPPTPEPPRHWRPEIPEGLEAVCLKCLAPDSAGRYPSAAGLAEDLRRFRSGEVLFIDDLDEPGQQRRWARRAGYEIVEVLGRDRDGFTYKARQVALDRVVVLKRVPAEDRFVPAAKARFRREAQLFAGLRHPNVVRLFDHGEQSDLAYFVREYVDGPSLAEAVTEKPMPVRTAAAVVEALARAMQAAHEQGVVHGGLNPDRVRLTPAGVPKITSFRRARLTGDENRRAAGYLAPEQLDGKLRMLSPATDVYALGAILYTLLTGQPPFVGPTLAETLEQVRTQPPRPCGADVAPELGAICSRCLEKQPGRRPVSAAALADEMRQFLSR
jgi:serine/threonine protein kinase